MTYQELKEKDIFSFSNLTEVKDYVTEVLKSDENDIIKYINYLKWYQYNGADVKEMKFISNFLSLDGLYEIDHNSELSTGDVEDLVIGEETESVLDKFKSENTTQTITVDNIDYDVCAVFEDPFESLFVVDDEGVLKIFGSITKDEEKYIYELPEEPEDFLYEVIGLETGTRVNFNSHYMKIGHCKKTFVKVDSNIEGTYISTKKSTYGVMAPVNGGTFSVLEKEEVYNSELENTVEELANKKYTEYVKEYEQKYVDIVNSYKEKLAQYEGNETSSPEAFVEKLNKAIGEKLKQKHDGCSCDGGCGNDGCGDDCSCDGGCGDDCSCGTKSETETTEHTCEVCKSVGKGAYCKECGNPYQVDIEDEDDEKIYNADELEFAISRTYEFGQYPTVVIQPKGYFKEHGYMCDSMGGHNINSGDLIKGGTSDCEEMESIFGPILTTEQQKDFMVDNPIVVDCDKWQEKMIDAGFTYEPDLEKFVN